MALLSQMFRTVAITGRTGTVNAWFASRQGGRWAEQTVQAVVPAARPRPERLRELDELHQRGVVTDAEYKQLRARLR